MGRLGFFGRPWLSVAIVHLIHAQPAVPWPNSLFTQDISADPLDSRSAAIIANMQPDMGWGSVSDTGDLHISLAQEVLWKYDSTPYTCVAVQGTSYTGECDDVGTGVKMPLPLGGFGGGFDNYNCTDCTIIVYDAVNQLLWESNGGYATPGDSFLTTTCLVVWDLQKTYPNNLRGDQCTTITSAGIPLGPLLTTADEVASGRITHALPFGLPAELMWPEVYAHPGTHCPSDNCGSTNYPYAGMRLRLKSTYDETLFPNPQNLTAIRIILTAMKTYGMVLMSHSSAPLWMSDDRRSTHKWADMNIDTHAMYGLPASEFEVVRPLDYQMGDEGLIARGNCVPLQEFRSTRNSESCGTDLCLALSTKLNVASCNNMPPAPAPSPSSPTSISAIISPVADLKANGSTGPPFIFTLPFNQEVRASTTNEIQANGCLQPVTRCEWQDPSSLMWSQQGCVLTHDNVYLGGQLGAVCNCTHLTVFALILRADEHAAPFCQAQTADYVLLVLYIILTILLFIQIIRLLRVRAALLLAQHFTLFVACIMRIVFLSAKPVLAPAGAVFVGLLPNALTFSLFLLLVAFWAAIQLFPMDKNPFQHLRIAFACMVTVVFLIVIALTVVVGVAPENTVVLLVGSYLLAAVAFVSLILMIVTGVGVMRLLTSNASTASNGTAKRMVRTVCSLAALLLAQAIIWVVAVDSGVLDSASLTFAVSILYYVVDLATIACLGLLLFSSVATTLKKQSHKSSQVEISRSPSRRV